MLRDQVIPVIDLRSRLFPSSRTAPGKSLVLITDGAAGVMGLKVDAVRQIITVAMDDLLPPPPLVGGIRGELLIAVISRAGEIYLLIDIENLLSGEEKLELESARLESPAD